MNRILPLIVMVGLMAGHEAFAQQAAKSSADRSAPNERTLSIGSDTRCWIPADGHRRCTCLGDYDNDRKTDYCVVDMDSGTWFLKPSTGIDPDELGLRRGWHWPGWQPGNTVAVTDADHDGASDPAIVTRDGKWIAQVGLKRAAKVVSATAAQTTKAVAAFKNSVARLDFDGDGQADRMSIGTVSGRLFVTLASGADPATVNLSRGSEGVVSSWVGNFRGVDVIPDQTLLLENGEFTLFTPAYSVTVGGFMGCLRQPGCVDFRLPERKEYPESVRFIGRLDPVISLENLHAAPFGADNRMSLAAYDPNGGRWLHGTVTGSNINWTEMDDPDGFNVSGDRQALFTREGRISSNVEGHVPGRLVLPLFAHQKDELPGTGLIMRTDVVIDDTRRLSAITETYQRTWLRGATGGVTVYLMRGDVRIWQSRTMWPLGVDGSWWGKNLRVDPWSDVVPEHILELADGISIKHAHVSKGTSLDELKKIFDAVKTIVQLFVPSVPDGSDGGGK